MEWTEARTAEIEKFFDELDPASRIRLESQASILFCQLKMAGELEHWPEVISQLNRTYSAKLLHLAIALGLVFTPLPTFKPQKTIGIGEAAGPGLG